MTTTQPISDQADKLLLQQKPRSAPIDVRTDAVLINSYPVLETLDESRDCRKFVTGCWIEVGAPAAKSCGLERQIRCIASIQSIGARLLRWFASRSAKVRPVLNCCS